jgi:ferric-dicitrate binding protein FerR (iron transport regulator)
MSSPGRVEDRRRRRRGDRFRRDGAHRAGPTILRQRTAWQDGVIELDGETLAQAVAEFNRYRGSPIIIGDPRLANLRVGGRFEVDEAEKFLTAVEGSFPVERDPRGRRQHPARDAL